jgi:polyisoprenoid-binding protein YceI
MADSTTAELRAGHWTLDAPASSVGIRNKSMWGLVTVKATFAKVGGAGEILADGSASGTLTVGAASVASGKARLDNHLRSADFFEVEKFPDFTFEVDQVVPKPVNTAEVSGRLTVIGRTRPLTFTARTSVAGPNEVTLAAEVDIDRSDFGMTWNKGGMLKSPTTVVLSLRFTHSG